MNDDFYYQHTFSDWLFGLFVSVGAFSAFVIALVVTL
jgi:hypothetical protein